jgi:hypothetical protein
MMNMVAGAVRSWLRLENLAVFFLSTILYAWLGHAWLLFIGLFLAPDLSFLGYLVGPRVGSHVYNLAHNYAAPIAIGVLGILGERSILVAIGLIWTAHIGLDRALGYGLKYPDGFGNTHLGRLGRRATPAALSQA